MLHIFEVNEAWNNRHQTPTRNVMSGTIFSIYLASAISAQFAALRISAPPAALKRWQKGCKKREERIVAKSKPTLNLVSHAATNSSTVQSPIASKSPGTLRALCQQDWKSTGKLVAREPNQKDASSSSQVWQKDAEMDKSTRRLVSGRKGPGTSEFPCKPEEYEESRCVRKLRHRR